MLGGLLVRAGGCGIACGTRCPLHHDVDVAGGERMMHQPGRVGDTGVDEGREHPALELDAARCGQRVDDRPAGQLVPEADALRAHGEQAALLSRPERPGRALDQSREQVRIHHEGHDRELLDVILRHPVEAPEASGDRVDDRRRHAHLVG